MDTRTSSTPATVVAPRPKNRRSPQNFQPSYPRPAAASQSRPSGMPKVTISFEVYVHQAPSLRSAVEELSSLVGTRLEGTHSYARESALTDAAITVGALRAAVNAKVAKGDDHYAG